MIIITCAMMDEAKTIAHYLIKKEEHPFVRYEGNVLGKEIALIVSGIGKANAASALTYALTLYPKAELIINVGIVGGFKVNRFETYLVEQASYHDVDVSIFNYEKGQIPHFPTWYQSDPGIMKKLSFLPSMKLYTGDIFSTKVFTDSPYIVDMEGSAFYQVAHRFKYPIISIKIVSDLVGSTVQIEEFNDGESDLADELYEDLIKVLEAIQ